MMVQIKIDDKARYASGAWPPCDWRVHDHGFTSPQFKFTGGETPWCRRVKSKMEDLRPQSTNQWGMSERLNPFKSSPRLHMPEAGQINYLQIFPIETKSHRQRSWFVKVATHRQLLGCDLSRAASCSLPTVHCCTACELFNFPLSKMVCVCVWVPSGKQYLFKAFILKGKNRKCGSGGLWLCQSWKE